MNMFPSLLDAIPKTRPQFVNDLDIPDISASPFVWTPEQSPRDSILSSASDGEVKTVSSESSLALSRAMTDSEIDYERHRRLKTRSFSDPWVDMRKVLDAFPPGYLDSLNSYQDTASESTESSVARPRYNEELRLKMERFFEEECRVFSPDDPGLLALQEALRESELKDSDLDGSLP